MIKYINELDEFSSTNRIQKKNICIINSGSISEIRENRDLDIALSPIDRIRFLLANPFTYRISKSGTIYISNNLQIVKNRYALLGINDKELFTDEYSLDNESYRIVKLEVEVAKKILYQRKKDIEDLELICKSCLCDSIDWKKVYELAFSSKPSFSYRTIMKLLKNEYNKIKKIIIKNKKNMDVVSFGDNEEFCAVIWGTMINYFDKIIDEISSKYKIVEIKYYNLCGVLNDFIENLYSVDNLEQWKIKIKQSYFAEKNNTVVFVKFVISNSSYRYSNRTSELMCNEEVNLKKEIRNKYKKYLNDYIYDVIIHIADNTDKSEKMNKIMDKYNKFLYPISK